MAASLYGLYGIYSRKIGIEFGAFSQNWIRNLLVAIIALVLFKSLRKKSVKLRTEDKKWIIGWILCGSWVTVFTFIAFNNLPIGTVYFLIYAAMIIGGFLSGHLFYKEKLTLLKIISLVLAGSGLLIIYSLTISKENIVFAILSLLGGFLTGFWNTLSKKFSNHYPTLQLVLIDSIASTLVAFIGAMVIQEKLSLPLLSKGFPWIMIYALTQIATVGLIITGFKNIEAQKGSIILPIEIIFAIIFAFLFFKEVPTVSAIFGGLLIIIAAIIPNLEK